MPAVNPIDVGQVVDDVLTMLSLEPDPMFGYLATTTQKVGLIVDGVIQALSIRLGGGPVPAELSYIVRDVSLARYNRIGSEGVSSHDVEGERMSWSKDDFSPYEKDIAAWAAQKKAPGGGVVRFL